MEYIVLAVLSTLLLLALLRRPLLNAVWVPTPGGAVLLASTLYIVGATVEVLQDEHEMALFVFATSIALFSAYLFSYFTFSSLLRLTAVPKSPGLDPRFGTSLTRRATVLFFVMVFGAVVGIVFVTGADRILTALYQFVVHGQIDVSVLELRIGLATGEERWVAPGYTKQVRDIILPLSVLLLLFGVKWRTGQFLLLSLLIIPAVSLLMISTGERAPVILFFLGVLYGAKRCFEWKLQSRRATAIPLMFVGALALGAFYSLTSSFTSREQEDMNTIFIFADRLVTRAPEENILGASVWSRGAPFPGASWLQELTTVLPGAQATLSNLIHEQLGGGDRGNSVLGMWIDVYYNFGWLLGIPVAILLGGTTSLFNHWVNTMRSRSRTAELCGMWLSVCMLLVLSPFGFLLYGPFTLSTFLFLAGLLARKPNPRASSNFGPVATR